MIFSCKKYFALKFSNVIMDNNCISFPVSLFPWIDWCNISFVYRRLVQMIIFIWKTKVESRGLVKIFLQVLDNYLTLFVALKGNMIPSSIFLSQKMLTGILFTVILNTCNDLSNFSFMAWFCFCIIYTVLILSTPIFNLNQCTDLNFSS